MITEKHIRDGLQQNEFLFYYQPKVSLVSGELAGAEALIRWKKSDGSIVAPWEFIPLAEKSDLINRISSHMFSRLVNDISILAGTGAGELAPISFNASAADFKDDKLTRQIIEAVEKFRINPKTIDVEITETAALEGGKFLFDTLALLHDCGIALTMDDYGTGYSSIDTLSKWPFTTIKIDQGIVRRMLESEKTATIVQSSIRMGHELNLNVVAEGVETEEQYHFLLEAGCKVVQGYLISEPLPLGKFTAFRQRDPSPARYPIGLIHMAIIDHIQWRWQLVRQVIRCAQLPPDSPLRHGRGYPELCHRKCALGQWYFGVGQVFSGHTGYRALDVPHRELHEIGSALIAYVEAGALLHEIAPLLEDLKECSKVLLGLLESLEDQGIAQLQDVH
jgi:EAL domain-containing protein (putative c-di-GMP-specific phosphodiesterase class I)